MVTVIVETTSERLVILEWIADAVDFADLTDMKIPTFNLKPNEFSLEVAAIAEFTDSSIASDFGMHLEAHYDILHKAALTLKEKFEKATVKAGTPNASGCW